MFAKKRRFEPAVIERLLEEPYRFDYFQAVRLLERWLRRHGGAAADPVATLLRFRNSTSLGFPASQLEAIELERGGDDDRVAGVHLTPTFMGLLGASGVLPAHYNERIAEHELRNKDEGPRAFLDTFSNRSLALFYAAWRKYRLPLAHEDGGDGFLPLLLSLAGLGNAALRRRLADERDGAVADESIGYFAAAFRHRPASSTQLGRVLTEYFGQRIAVEQFVGHWYALPPDQQTVLGEPTAVLGTSAMAGARVWQRDLRLRLVVGPLDHAGFDAFLPGGLAARALRSMLALFTGVTLEYEVEVVLRAADVRAVHLQEGPGAGRLGWDAFLVDGPQAQDRHDVCYALDDL